MRQIVCDVAVAAVRQQLFHFVYVYLYRMILRVIPCKSRCRLYNMACLHSFFRISVALLILPHFVLPHRRYCHSTRGSFTIAICLCRQMCVQY